MKLKSLLLILVVFFILKSVSSPYNGSYKNISSTYAGTVATAGRWVIVDQTGHQVLYNNSVTPLTFRTLTPHFSWWRMTTVDNVAIIRNMLIGPQGEITQIDSTNNTWHGSPNNMPVTRVIPPAVFDAWSCAMGDTLISVCGTVTTYLPATNSWTPQVQGPPNVLPSLWYVTIGNKVVTVRGEKMSTLVNGTWSAAVPGPGPASNDGTDVWVLSMGNILISSFGKISKYTTSWSTPTQGLPYLTYNVGLPSNSTVVRDKWVCVADTLVISIRGQVCKLVNGVFTNVATRLPKVNGVNSGMYDQWFAAIKI